MAAVNVRVSRSTDRVYQRQASRVLNATHALTSLNDALEEPNHVFQAPSHALEEPKDSIESLNDARDVSYDDDYSPQRSFMDEFYEMMFDIMGKVVHIGVNDIDDEEEDCEEGRQSGDGSGTSIFDL